MFGNDICAGRLASRGMMVIANMELKRDHATEMARPRKPQRVIDS
jgi:hypothetical protein